MGYTRQEMTRWEKRRHKIRTVLIWGGLGLFALVDLVLLSWALNWWGL
jgi:hypothetical protein